MTGSLHKALQRREELERELELLDQYIDLHVKLFGGGKVEAVGTASVTTRAEGVGIAKNEKTNDPKAVANGVESLLRDAEGPVQRGKLITLLAENGIPIHSQDKSKYIGTILWRNRDRFVNVEGKGYWLKSRALPGHESLFE